MCVVLWRGLKLEPAVRPASNEPTGSGIGELSQHSHCRSNGAASKEPGQGVNFGGP